MGCDVPSSILLSNLYTFGVYDQVLQIQKTLTVTPKSRSFIPVSIRRPSSDPFLRNPVYYRNRTRVLEVREEDDRVNDTMSFSPPESLCSITTHSTPTGLQPTRELFEPLIFSYPSDFFFGKSRDPVQLNFTNIQASIFIYLQTLGTHGGPTSMSDSLSRSLHFVLRTSYLL